MGVTDRRLFTKEFKQEAVRRAMEPGVRLIDVASELDIGAGMLGRWIREITKTTKSRRIDVGALAAGNNELVPAARQPKDKDEKRDGELARLREQVAKLTKERDKLKSTLAFYIDDEQ